MNYNRELEKKFVVSDISLEETWARLCDWFPNGEVMAGVSTDTFWRQSGTDFIRLRKNSMELSVKITDKATIEDRVEENIVVDDFDTAYRFSTAVFGQPVGTLEKNYFVLTMPNFILALYTVTGYDEVYLEVESADMFHVNTISSFLNAQLTMRQEFRSLFQIILGEKVAA